MSTRTVTGYLNTTNLAAARRLAAVSYANTPSYLAEELREATVGEHLRDWVGDHLTAQMDDVSNPDDRLLIMQLITEALLNVDTRELARAFLSE